MKTTKEEELSEIVKCKTCGESINWLAVFPGGICAECHEIKFNKEVKKNSGILPRPDFSAIFN